MANCSDMWSVPRYLCTWKCSDRIIHMCNTSCFHSIFLYAPWNFDRKSSAKWGSVVCVENCHFGKSFFFLTESCLFVVFFLPRCCWSFVVLCRLVLFLSFLSFPVSSGLLYFSWEFFSLYLFIPEGSDSLVSISGFHPHGPGGWGPPQDNNVYSSRLWTLSTAGMAAVKNPPSPFSLPHPPVGCENW